MSAMSRRVRSRRVVAPVALLALVAFGAAACGDDDDAEAVACFDPPATEPVVLDPEADVDGTTVRVITHSAFAVSDDVVAEFEAETGIEIQFVESDDAGTMVAQTILTAGNPVADVMYGLDNTFLCRALEADVLVPYESARLEVVADELRLDPHGRVTPVDYGDVCINWWADEVAVEPTSLDDLRSPELAGEWVTPSPETSSPGLALLLSTVAAYGEDWPDFWSDAVAGGMSVTSGWSGAYFGEFIAGGGDRAVVTSYATSPVAEVIFAETPVDESPTRVLTDGCFRQVEFAGILAGTPQPQAAARVVDFFLSVPFQEDVPLQMFVFPAAGDAQVPQEFLDHAVTVDDPLTLDPAEIEANRDAWVDEWRAIVFG